MTSQSLSANAFQKISVMSSMAADDTTVVSAAKFASRVLLKVCVVAFAALEVVSRSILLIPAALISPIKPRVLTDMTESIKSAASTIVDITWRDSKTSPLEEFIPEGSVSEEFVPEESIPKGSVSEVTTPEKSMPRAAVPTESSCSYFEKVVARVRSKGERVISYIRENPRVVAVAAGVVTDIRHHISE